MNGAPLIAIGLATFLRPQYLKELLLSMTTMQIGMFCVHLIVVDNDPAGSAQLIVEELARQLPFSVTYVIEDKRGHPAVRNRLVREATRISADFLDIVDDDQIVTPSWLNLLLDAAYEYNADAVWGRWLPLYEAGVPKWVQKSGYFEQKTHKTGTVMRYASDGTTLFRMSALQQLDGPFDESKGLAGGADTVLFDEMYRRGFTTVRCAESTVYERIHPSRATVQWMIKRSFGSGVSFGTIVTRRDGSIASIAMRSTRAVGLIAKSCILLPPLLLQGRSGVVPQIADLARGIGFFVGAIAGRDIFEGYRKIHGR